MTRSVLTDRACDRPADFYMSLYNVVFTALSPMVIGLLDQDVDKAMSSRFAGMLCAVHRERVSPVCSAHPAGTMRAAAKQSAKAATRQLHGFSLHRVWIWTQL